MEGMIHYALDYFSRPFTTFKNDQATVEVQFLDPTLENIFKNLSIPDLLSASLVSRKWALKSSSDELWQAAANDLGCSLPRMSKQSKKSQLILLIQKIQEVKNYYHYDLYVDPYWREIPLLYLKENALKRLRVGDLPAPMTRCVFWNRSTDRCDWFLAVQI